MPPFYEDAAHLMLFLIRAGLVIRPGVDCRIALLRLADRLLVRQRDARGLTHFGAATWILDDLEKLRLVSCDRKMRLKIIAVLGTGIANIEATGTASK